MNKVKIAVVGTGQIAQNFHLPIYFRLPNVELIAVLDPDRMKAELIAERYAIKNIYTDIDELLDLEEIDAIDICTPTNTHLDYALKAIEKNKNVLIEKPIARNYEEAEIIHKAASEKPDLKVMVGMNQRFRYDARLIKNFIDADELGDLFYIQSGWLQKLEGKNWRKQFDISGGGVVIDLGISLIDSILWFFDFEEIQSVSAKTYNHRTKNVEDVCLATLNFKNGSFVQLEMSWSLFNEKSNFYCNVHGSKGSMKINPIEIFKIDGDLFTPDEPKDNISKLEMYRKSFESEIKHFINAVAGHSPVISNTAEAVKTMKIVDLIYKSSKENKEMIY